MQNIRHSLTLRIAFPIAVLVFVLGASLYFLVLTTISGFVQSEIERDLKSLSHRIYDICNVTFDDILHAGLADDQDTLIIKQAIVLGQFEDFFRQENLEGLVYKLKNGDLLLETTLPISPNKIMGEGKPQGQIISLGTEAEDYFAYHFDFSPWDWKIVILKSKSEYSYLITQVQRVHFYTLGLLILATFLLVFFLHQSIKRPIDAIIKPIKKGERPEYKGIDVFEFLSDTISIMMNSLQESEEKYRLLADNAADVICIINLKQFNFDYVSPSSKFVFGYTPEEAASMNVNDLLTLGSIEKMKDVLEGQIGKEKYGKAEPQRLELEVRCKDGIIAWMETSARFLRDDKKQITRILCVIRDITERKQAEKALKESEEKVARLKKMESLGLLAGGVAHDLNNVLSGIISYPELILLDLPEGSELRKPIKAIQESGHRAAAIVQDLITVARGVATVKEPLNLNTIVKDYLLSPEFKKLEQFHSTVTVKTDLDADLFNVKGSQVHIRKAVMNLISNASEAVEGGGNVIISTMNRYVDRPVRGYHDINVGEYIVLSVSDDGLGIPSNDLDRIFEPFYTKKIMGRSGTGLGLTVVWNILQDHNGYIDVSSDKNGTTFELYFPITRDELLDEYLPISIKDYKGDGETILIVDDVETQREISCSILDILGYKTKAVSSGEEAVEYLKEHTVDIILLDMIMDPGISGRETYERIIKIHPNQKAIIVSGFAETDEVKETIRLGANRYIRKPYTLEEIGMAVKEALMK